MAARVNIHQRGWLDTQERIREVFKEDPLITSLKTRNGTTFVDKGSMSAAEASKWAYLVTYASYRLEKHSSPNPDQVQAVALGELIAPVLPASYFLDVGTANTKLTEIVKFYMANETPMNRGKTKAGFINLNNSAAENQLDDDWSEINEEIADDRFIHEHGVMYVHYLLLPHPADTFLVPLDLYVTLYIAVAKRGNVTPDFLNKVARGMDDDLQHVADLSDEVIKKVYRFYGGHITADNAKDIMDRWIQDIPEVALRVRLTLQQATNSGLTALVTTGRAIRKYPDFDWARLNALTGGELTNLQAAITLVGGNQYYGFNKSLGAARSTLYNSVSYVAKELLISLNGEVSLKRYMGWIRAPKNATVIKEMIERYKTSYTARLENAEISEADTTVARNIGASLADAVNADLYA